MENRIAIFRIIKTPTGDPFGYPQITLTLGQVKMFEMLGFHFELLMYVVEE